MLRISRRLPQEYNYLKELYLKPIIHWIIDFK
jgi:hypothetical protein